MNTLFALAGKDLAAIQKWIFKIVNHHLFHHKQVKLFVSENVILGEVYPDYQAQSSVIQEMPFSKEILRIDGNPTHAEQAQRFTDCLHVIKGFYALWAANADTNELHFATDYLASHPIFYSQTGPVFMASNNYKLLASFCSNNIDQNWLRDVLIRHYSGFDYTFFREIKRVPPGSALTYELSGSISMKRYKDVYPQNFASISVQQSIEQLDDLMYKSTSRTITGYQSIGVELSAGIDSSAVLAYSGKLAGLEKVQAFSHVNLENGVFQTDEREDIQSILTFLPELKHHFVDAGNQGILHTISDTIDQLGFVPNQFFEVFSQNLFQEAQFNGVDLMLSGFGGDQGISYKGKMFFHQLFREGKWKSMAREMSLDPKTSSIQSLKLILAMTGEWLFPKNYDHLKQNKYEKDFSDHQVNQFVKKEWIEKYNLKDLFIKNNLERNLYQEVHQAQYHQLVHPFVTQRLQMAYLIARYMGFSYKHPLLDEDLVRFFLEIPYQHKFQHGVNRYLIRELIKDKMPATIYAKTSKQGAAVPSVFDRIYNETDRLLAFVTYCDRKNIGTELFRMDAIKDALHQIKKRQGKDMQNLPRIINYITLMVYFAKKEGMHAFFEKS